MAKPKIFTIWPLTGKVHLLLLSQSMWILAFSSPAPSCTIPQGAVNSMVAELVAQPSDCVLVLMRGVGQGHVALGSKLGAAEQPQVPNAG